VTEGARERTIMNRPTDIKALFLDIGGVLLTNGWDRSMRRRAAETFRLDLADMDERHHLTFDTFEVGKLSLDEYLNRIVFFQDRPFAREDFKAFMFSQSQPHPDMIDFVRALKAHYRLKIAVVSNEGRELTLHRIRKFSLSEFVDFFVVSCFVHFRKPDKDIFRMALDLAQVPPDRVVYVEDRLMFIEVARGFGIQGIHHTGYASTKTALAEFGLSLSSSPDS
jgi:putative hydrolase of the HAD superfamily